MRRVVQGILFIMPFVLSTWILVWWLAHGAPPAEIFMLIVALPAAFIIALVMALVVWFRPDVREQREVTWPDAAWIVGTWLAWLVGGALGGGAGIIVMLVAFWLGVAAIVWLWRRLHRETTRRLDDFAARQGSGAGGAGGAAGFGTATGRGRGGPGPGGPAEGPDAGKVITVHPSTPSNGDADDGVGGGQGHSDGGRTADSDQLRAGFAAHEGRDGTGEGMPGSARIEGAVPGIDDTRPGVNFGANRAPMADDWDPTRPVPGAPDASGISSGTGDESDATRESASGQSASGTSASDTSDGTGTTKARGVAGVGGEVDDDDWAGPGTRR